MPNYGFYFDMESCIGCRTCQIACKDKNALDIGILYREVLSYEVGAFPAVGAYHFSKSCNHCQAPACVASCPTEAMHIDQEYGIVLVDEEICIGCQNCVKECPYEVPKYIEDKNVAGKCDSCKQLRESGEKPACVAACPMRALDFDDVDVLKEKYGSDCVNKITILPDPAITNPDILIKAKAAALEPDPMQMVY